MPRAKREAMFAIYAFAREIDDIADGASSAESKRIALDGWRDEIAQVYAGRPATPIGGALAAANARFALPRDEFIALMTRAGAPPEAITDPAPIEIIEGIVDLAFRTDDGWVLVDYKSDVAATRIEVWRRTRYRAQVSLYAAAWERITGETVAERVLLYTVTGDTDRW